MQHRRFLSLILSGLLLVVSVPVLAGSFTITTTAQQDAALTVLLAQRNADLAKQGKPAITREEYIQIESSYILNQTVEHARDAVKGALMQAIESGNSATEAALRKALESLK